MTAQPLSAAEQARLAAIEAALTAEESIRERVARAMCETDIGRPVSDDHWHSIDPGARRSYGRLADAAIDVLRGPSSDAEQAVERVLALARELGTRYPDAPHELQSILTAVAADIRTTIADDGRGEQ